MQILSKILDLSYDFLKNVTLNKTAKVVINKFKKSNIDLYQAKNIFKIWDLARSNYKKELNTFLMEANYYSKSFTILHN